MVVLAGISCLAPTSWPQGFIAHVTHKLPFVALHVRTLLNLTSRNRNLDDEMVEDTPLRALYYITPLDISVQAHTQPTDPVVQTSARWLSRYSARTPPRQLAGFVLDHRRLSRGRHSALMMLISITHTIIFSGSRDRTEHIPADD